MTITKTEFIWASVYVILIRRLWLISILLLGYCDESVIGQLTLFPTSVASVCSVGDPLQLTCTAPVESGIKWDIFQSESTFRFVGDVVITIGSAKNQRTPVTVNSVMFTFTKTSDPGASPLVSTLSIDSVSSFLNGSVVNCSDLSDSTTSAATTIQIIDTHQNFLLYTPILRVSDEHYETDNVIVTVEWTPQEGVTYTTSVSPLTSIAVTGNSSRQLMIPYNTNYNVSVKAAPPCSTAVITLNYAKCDNPEMLFTFDNDTVPRVDGMILTSEGSTVSFSCPPGFVLTGPDSATCTGNGEWELDSRRIMCNNISNRSEVYTDLESTTVQECMPKSECSLAAAVSSSIFTFIATSTIIFIAGFMIGRYFRFKRKFHITTTDQDPVYDYIQPSTAKPQENLEIIVNVAYEASKSITIER